ncbi:hypothetical protein B0T25DRAFT_557345 [Lasiosphaeria hispida]|uniref:Uncharacterized protein n=1 Tax=Lasiosphaeria hispida TaxID=260671 RepID=A0AAJ0H669_9PEZI|nr:hypothetical protein B0T25DRAFT_557345 [Lasiosphaeria hispida]
MTARSCFHLSIYYRQAIPPFLLFFFIVHVNALLLRLNDIMIEWLKRWNSSAHRVAVACVYRRSFAETDSTATLEAYPYAGPVIQASFVRQAYATPA